MVSDIFLALRLKTMRVLIAQQALGVQICCQMDVGQYPGWRGDPGTVTLSP